MRISDSCAKCLYDRQCRRSQDAEYLAEVRALLDARSEEDTSPLMVYRFNQAYVRRFGNSDSYADVKRHYNDLVLHMEKEFETRIKASPDPLAAALSYARIGNYIDFGAMDSVDESTFLHLFDEAGLRAEETETYQHFLESCAKGKNFLLIADNCGEIVLDRLFLEQLHARFPHLHLQVLVRGGEVLNDVTVQDAVYAGVDRLAEILSNGAAVAGTVYEFLPDDARKALNEADIILAKGQANYESLSGRGFPVFYVFLCKCELFTTRFHVPKLTGMLVEENQSFDLTFHTVSGRFNYRTGAIIIHQGKLLLMRNTEAPYVYTVGGRVKFDETTEEAVVRETLEETGIRMEIERPLMFQEQFFDEEVSHEHVHEIAVYYLMKDSDALENIQCNSITERGASEELFWLPLTDIDKVKFVPESVGEFLTRLPEQFIRIVEIDRR